MKRSKIRAADRISILKWDIPSRDTFLISHDSYLICRLKIESVDRIRFVDTFSLIQRIKQMPPVGFVVLMSPY